MHICLRLILSLLICVGYLASCKPKSDPLRTQVNDYLRVAVKNQKPMDEDDVLMFIPANGCSYCLSHVLERLKSSPIGDPNFRIVLAAFGNTEVRPLRRDLAIYESRLAIDIGYQYEKHLNIRVDAPFYIFTEDGLMKVNNINAENYKEQLKFLVSLLK